MTRTRTLTNLSGIRLLYVEDDLETREELQSILELYVAELYAAKNGKQGLALYKQYKPDIIVTDIQMPEMNGLSMAADIKNINPEQQIVVLSAYNDVEYLFRALELEIQHYITKPVSVERLLNKLSEITEQMNLARDVANSHKLLEQYKLLVDEKAIVVKIDLNGNITYVNQHFCDLSGYSEAELLGQHYLFSFDGTDQQEILDDLKKSVIEIKKWKGLLKKRTKSGAVYAVDASVIAVVDANNEIEEFVALMVDMTEVYEKFERLALNLKQDLSEQKHYLHEYERALEVGTSLCVIDTDGKIISANRNFGATLDYSTEELVGQSLCDLVQDCKDFKNRVLKKVGEQGFSSRVIKVQGKGGLLRTLSTVIVGIHNQHGEIHSLMSLSHDISETVQLNESIIENQKDLIYVLGEVVENRSQETGLHIKRVALISELLALKYGLSEDYAAMIKVASPLHDIGKIGIPDNILHKPAKLSEAEYKIMKSHAELGFQLLNKLDKPLIKMAATIAHEHHEKYNGSGYPSGLVGEHIAIEARIVSLVDVFDALSTRRIYKEPWTDQEIVAYLNKNKGIQFDPELVDLFLENLDEILRIRDLLKEQ
ncbi:MAG: PAS domain S-box protein [Methylomonas sp.]|jgi:PAS domain S-box-containing protein|uniref:HD domain-containing phosphohydrolase n=1 Tax=Methylomonas sp. TaxID=418 RepID=UPI0025D17109|nr:HD domain-containing phosphohydrolase [Methylomonas sp.]MCK9605681.1 PAS domain S-box protein [Methylomonas sp.]